ncbi:thymidine kinase [Flavobacteriales bacterium]|jgi:thymidine kinase|nr:thymidine kinase [Flavobacteriales bacterium]MDC3395076.1 thymidine kinase [Flavobacteriales bacterium]
MFLESQINHPMQKGSIEVICGSMFSGKTEELLRRLKRAQFAKLNIAVFKPKIDKRYDTQKVVSHDENTIQATPIDCAENILKLANEAQVVAIDEAQFFNSDLVAVSNELANAGVRVIIAGLDMDFLGNPFGVMPQILAIAEHITKVHAICVECNEIANHSFRKNANKNLVQLGEKQEYKPLCRSCFSSKMK